MTDTPDTHTLVLPASGSVAPVDMEHGSLFFIGTATLILRYASFTILTDPNFLHQGEQVHIGYGLRSTRKTNPAIDIEELPSIDLVVLSHMHEDHFDRVVEQKLDKTLPIITTGQASRYLSKKGFTATQPLDTWETMTIVKGDAVLHITAMPGRHGPGLMNLLMPPVMGSMLEFQTRSGITTLRVYITGDTLLYDGLREIPRRYPEIDLGIFHLGGTKIMGVLLTMDAREGIRAVELIAPHTAIPVHYDDYTVFKSPLEDFKRAVAAQDVGHKVKYLNRGETYQFAVPARKRSGDIHNARGEAKGV